MVNFNADDLEIIRRSILFKNISQEELCNVLQCLNAVFVNYTTGQYLYRVGDRTEVIAIVINGSFHIEKEDCWGNLSILADISPGEMCGEVFACIRESVISVNAVAKEDSKVLLINVEKVLGTCDKHCIFHTKIINNLIDILARKNHMLTSKIEIISQRSIRSRLMEYLSQQAQLNGSNKFEIPYNRQQLADYLAVDRSALSTELGRMSKDGLIEFKKNKFVIDGEFKI